MFRASPPCLCASGGTRIRSFVWAVEQAVVRTSMVEPKGSLKAVPESCVYSCVCVVKPTREPTQIKIIWVVSCCCICGLWRTDLWSQCCGSMFLFHVFVCPSWQTMVNHLSFAVLRLTTTVVHCSLFIIYIHIYICITVYIAVQGIWRS